MLHREDLQRVGVEARYRLIFKRRIEIIFRVAVRAQTERERERVHLYWICAILIYSVVSSKSLIKKERQGKPEWNKSQTQGKKGQTFVTFGLAKILIHFSKVRVWKDTHEQR